MRKKLRGKTEATVKAVLWTDGGTSGGQNVIEWCCVLVDDAAEVFECSVTELTPLDNAWTFFRTWNKFIS